MIALLRQMERGWLYPASRNQVNSPCLREYLHRLGVPTRQVGSVALPIVGGFTGFLV